MRHCKRYARNFVTQDVMSGPADFDVITEDEARFTDRG